MRITISNDGKGIETDVQATKKELSSKLFLQDFSVSLMTLCDSVAMKKGITGIEERKRFTKDILDFASKLSETVFDMMAEEKDKAEESDELAYSMDEIYDSEIRACMKSMKKTEAEIWEMLSEDEDYCLVIDEKSSSFHFILSDGKKVRIPLGKASKKGTDDDKFLASATAFIFAGSLLSKAVSVKKANELLNKYDNQVAYLFNQIKCGMI